MLYTIGITLFGSFLYARLNPLKFYHRREKTKLLHYCDNQVGPFMILFNDILPHHFTENHVDRMIAELYW